MSQVLKIYKNNDETFEVMLETSDAFKSLLKNPARTFNTSTRRWKLPNNYKESFLQGVTKLNPTINVKEVLDYDEALSHKPKKFKPESTNIVKLTNENSSEFGVQFRFSHELLNIVKVSSNQFTFLSIFY